MRPPEKCPPRAAQAKRSELNLGRAAMVSSSARLPVVEKNRYNRQSWPADCPLATNSIRCGAGRCWLVEINRPAREHGVRRWTTIRTIATARAATVVRPVRHETVAIDRREPFLWRAAAMAARKAQRYQQCQRGKFSFDDHVRLLWRLIGGCVPSTSARYHRRFTHITVRKTKYSLQQPYQSTTGNGLRTPHHGTLRQEVF